MPTVPFTEDFQFPGLGKTICFDAKSYMAWIYQTMPFLRQIPITDLQATPPSDTIKLGDYIFQFARFPQKESDGTPTRLRLFGEDGTGFCCFDGDAAVPMIFEPDPDEGRWKTWMSLTPNEIMTCNPGVEAATGRVLVGGCGLGWMAQKIAQKPNVTAVTVVDIMWRLS